MRFPFIVVGLIFFQSQQSNSNTNPGFLESIINGVLHDGLNNALNEPRDQTVIDKTYDFIIVGAGSAGCLVANRLSEFREWKVLLIEAGGEENFLMDIPVTVNFWQLSRANWAYTTEPSPYYCLAMRKGRCHWPRGKVIGGSSVLNYMIYTRGGKKDYDIWEELGNKGWSWDNVLPYFKKIEGDLIHRHNRGEKFYPASGHMTLSAIPYKTPIADIFMESGRYLGYPILDYKAQTPKGFNYLRVSMKNGTRWSSSRAFLHSARRRSNLHVKKWSTVTKVVIDPITKIAVGVEFVSKKRKYFVKATKEIILSGGSINSAHLLMLSGIGPEKHLKSKNIFVVKDAKVGYNLQDHYLPGGLTYTIDQPYTITSQRLAHNRDPIVNYFSFHTGPLSSPGACEALAYFNLDNVTEPDALPNMELLLVAGGLTSEASLYKNFNLKTSIYKNMYEPLQNQDTVMIFPILLTPKSKGKIVLQDNNPFHHPLIYPNYFSDPEGYDMRVIIDGIRKSNQVMSAPPFQKLGTRQYKKPLPPCNRYEFDSRDYWECFARHMTFTIYHPVGTCKMGPDNDPTAVVDERLRVRGIQHLRVIDASIMPVIPSAHTNAPTYMIAEKGSHMIKQDWGLMDII